MRWLRLGFVIATILGAILFLVRQQDDIFAALDRANPGLLLAGIVLSIGNALFACWSWYAIMWPHRRKLAIGPAMRLFFLSQLGKYLPGGIWPFLAAAELGRDAGFERRFTVGSFTLAIIVGLATAAMTAAIFLPQSPAFSDPLARWLWLGMLPILALLHPAVRGMISRVARLDELPGASCTLMAVFMSFLAWIFAGIQLFLLSSALGTATGILMIFAFTGIYAASWAIGFLFMIAPAGFGPREATMIALLVSFMPLADAALVALLSRVGMTLADLLGAGLVATLPSPRPGR